MRDSGIVVSTGSPLARVEVDCLSSCQDCSAHALCIGRSQSKGMIFARNTVAASEGDRVTIEVPEPLYARSLTLLFGGLLLSGLTGLGAGALLASVSALDIETAGLAGLGAALLAGAGILARYFKKENQKSLYPVIIEITQEGACHGQT